MSEQGNLFDPTPEQPAFNAEAVANHIAANAKPDPYAEQEKRQLEIDDLRRPVVTDDRYVVGPNEHKPGQDQQWRIPAADKARGKANLAEHRPKGF